MRDLKPIHPFPARMASSIALHACGSLHSGAVVLDPMSGSGSVLRAASEIGHQGIGFDMDPMAVLITKVWTTPINVDTLKNLAEQIVNKAESIPISRTELPWIDEDKKTEKFIDFWFGERQRNDLRKLCTVLQNTRCDFRDALHVAVSRLIITKKKGASLAGDVSHSRPHRIRTENDFDVFNEFRKSVSFIGNRLEEKMLRGKVVAQLGDSRRMNTVESESIDAIITSPPYLNAIDYLRGHKLSLVWLGHTISSLSIIRSCSVGAERVPEPEANLQLAQKLTTFIDENNQLPNQRRRMIDRYALDIYDFMKEAYRVLKVGGKIILVIGDSCHKDVYVENSRIIKFTAKEVGFIFKGQHVRNIPPSRRYLPPPSEREASGLKNRMRREAVQTYEKQ